MNRKLKVIDEHSLEQIKQGNRVLVNKIITAKPILSKQTSKPKPQLHVQQNIKGQL